MREAERSEEQLCAAALCGDTAAWNALIARHNHRVILTLVASGVAADRARDLAQEVWLRLLEQQRKGRLSTLVLPGLALKQARFLALELRRKSAVEQRADEQSAHELVDPGPGAESRVVGEEQLARALNALDACHPTAQRVFSAVYEDPDRPQIEVAREVGLSLQRVRQVLCEVRKKLRDALSAPEKQGCEAARDGESHE